MAGIRRFRCHRERNFILRLRKGYGFGEAQVSLFPVSTFLRLLFRRYLETCETSETYFKTSMQRFQDARFATLQHITATMLYSRGQPLVVWVASAGSGLASWQNRRTGC